jgi:hypothetical protein
MYDIGIRRGGQYVAEARFCERETLTAQDPGELLRKIRQHCPGPPGLPVTPPDVRGKVPVNVPARRRSTIAVVST